MEKNNDNLIEEMPEKKKAIDLVEEEEEFDDEIELEDDDIEELD